MRIRFDSGLAWEEILAEGQEEIEGILDGSIEEDGDSVLLARFDQPVLVTDPWRIAQLPPRRRDVVAHFLGLPKRVIEYDGVELRFDQSRHPRVWSPSIDTLLVCRAIRAQSAAFSQARTALEVGCGSGYLALYLMESVERAGKPLEEIHVVDIEPQAIDCAMHALEPRSGPTVVSASLGRRGESLRVRGRFDVIVLNPPYIRRPPELSTSRYRDNPWEGVSLIRELAERGPSMLNEGGSLLITVSSLCDQLVMPWLEASFHVTETARMDVPLKVYSVVSGLTEKSRRWMEFLQESEGLRVEEPPRDGYDTWQTIRVLRCQPRKS